MKSKIHILSSEHNIKCLYLKWDLFVIRQWFWDRWSILLQNYNDLTFSFSKVTKEFWEDFETIHVLAQRNEESLL